MKEAIKARAKVAGAHNMKPYLFILLFIGIFIHVCLSFTPIVSLFEKYNGKRHTQKISNDINYTIPQAFSINAGDYPQAMAAYKQAIAKYPYDPDVYGNLGTIYFNQKDYDQAIANFDKAIAINPNYYWVYSDLSAVHSEQGRYDLSLQDINKAISLDQCSESFLNGSNFYVAALAGSKIKFCQESAQIYFNLASIYSLQGAYNLAIDSFSKAIARDPNLAKAYERRAICYFNMKNYIRSRQDAQKAQMLGRKVDPALLEVP